GVSSSPAVRYDMRDRRRGSVACRPVDWHRIAGSETAGYSCCEWNDARADFDPYSAASLDGAFHTPISQTSAFPSSSKTGRPRGQLKTIKPSFIYLWPLARN